MSKKIIVAITGASGTNYAIALLTALKEQGIKSHVIVSDWAKKVLVEEQNDFSKIKRLSTKIYSNNDLSASISSSSFLVNGMIIIPCSVKTISDIVHANTNTLISRSADNMLKMRNKLIIGVRETPLSGPTLENLLKLSLYGAIIFPLSPGFYHKPTTINDIEDFIVGKALDLLGVPNNKFVRWKS